MFVFCIVLFRKDISMLLMVFGLILLLFSNCRMFFKFILEVVFFFLLFVFNIEVIKLLMLFVFWVIFCKKFLNEFVGDLFWDLLFVFVWLLLVDKELRKLLIRFWKVFLILFDEVLFLVVLLLSCFKMFCRKVLIGLEFVIGVVLFNFCRFI